MLSTSSISQEKIHACPPDDVKNSSSPIPCPSPREVIVTIVKKAMPFDQPVRAEHERFLVLNSKSKSEHPGLKA